jgi:hypothetical protein
MGQPTVSRDTNGDSRLMRPLDCLGAFWAQKRFDAVEYFNFKEPMKYQLENVEP